MASLGAFMLGSVFGWIAALAARPFPGRDWPSWRQWGFFCFSGGAAAALAFIHEGYPGLAVAALGFVLGALAGAACLGLSSQWRSKGG